MFDTLNSINNWLTIYRPLLTLYLLNLLGVGIILGVGWVAANIAAHSVNNLVRAHITDSMMAGFFSKIARYTILVVAVLMALERVGVQTASIITVLGGAMLAIGLALQGSLANVAAGVLLVLQRPFRVQEYVDLGGVAGTVTEVHIFTTKLLTPDNKVVVLPNGKVMAGNIINFSREPQRRIDFTIGIAYRADLDTVKKIFEEIILADRRVIKEKEITIRLNDMAASSLNIVVRVWVPTELYSDVYFDLMENFKRALDSHHIHTPYPHVNVHLHPDKEN